MMNHLEFLNALSYQIKAYAIVNKGLRSLLNEKHANHFVPAAYSRTVAEDFGAPAVDWIKKEQNLSLVKTIDKDLILKSTDERIEVLYDAAEGNNFMIGFISFEGELVFNQK